MDIMETVICVEDLSKLKIVRRVGALRVKPDLNSKLVLTFAAAILTFLAKAEVFAIDLGGKTCKTWEVLEWEIANSTCPVSNPYDIVARAGYGASRWPGVWAVSSGIFP